MSNECANKVCVSDIAHFVTFIWKTRWIYMVEEFINILRVSAISCLFSVSSITGEKLLLSKTIFVNLNIFGILKTNFWLGARVVFDQISPKKIYHLYILSIISIIWGYKVSILKPYFAGIIDIWCLTASQCHIWKPVWNQSWICIEDVFVNNLECLPYIVTSCESVQKIFCTCANFFVFASSLQIAPIQHVTLA